MTNLSPTTDALEIGYVFSFITSFHSKSSLLIFSDSIFPFGALRLEKNHRVFSSPPKNL